MITNILDALLDKESAVNKAVESLKEGLPVAFPTETVYGLGAGIFDLNAIELIYKIKVRDARNPLAAHISSIRDAEILCENLSDDFYLLAEAFLPGPLSIVMRKSKIVSDKVSGSSGTISIRMPDHEVFTLLSKKFGQPIAATSANISGNPSPVEASHVFDDLNGKIPIILDAGRCSYRIESTVISLLNKEPVLIRPGAVSQKSISQVLNKEIKSNDKQVVLYNYYKNAMERKKMTILSLDSQESIKSYYNANPSKKILIMTRSSNFGDEFNKIQTNESTFFQDLREAEKKGIEILLVDKDNYVMQSDVLRHRLKLS